MKAWLRHPVRVTARLLWFCGELTLALALYGPWCAFRSRQERAIRRADWLQYCSRRMLRVVRVSYQATGPVPTRGLLVSNHLSYLDIPVVASLTRAAFVSKHELKYWPVLGWLACAAGTLFVNRGRPSQAGRAVSELQAAMGNGVVVVLFPEGTSSDGSSVLPFKSSMLEPVVRQDHPLFVSRISYELDDGIVGEDVCYWKDMIFVPHLLKLLSKRSIRAFVKFSPAQTAATDRKQLARDLHSAVVGLEESL